MERDHSLNEIEMEKAIEAILKKSKNKRGEPSYQEQLERYRLEDNEETLRLLTTMDNLSTKSAIVGSKVNRLQRLNERGMRQL